mmetsp:Transcript_24106/g.66821  ORF Transcript_24106/g.66821 Transcript_24106/m.66821 type:complete len:456 (+) Transcript_24106:128-1495(+)
MIDDYSASRSMDLSAYPPFLVAWPINIVDTLCDRYLGRFCSHWRNLLPESLTSEDSSSWFSVTHKMMKTPNEYMPELLSYQEFVNSGVVDEAPFLLDSMKRFAFATSSTSLANVLSWSSLLALVVLISCFRLLKANIMPVFSNMARNYCRKTHGPDWEKDKANAERIYKFGEYVFRLSFHSVISIVGIWLFFDKPWWSSVSQFLLGGGGDNTTQPMGTKSLYINYPFQPVEPGMIWYYLVQCAYNAEAMINLLEISFRIGFQPIKHQCSNQGQLRWQLPIKIQWSESCRGDFREMFVHHIFTNLLVIGSSFYRLQYIGSMVFIVHDISDIPVDLSKLANFLKWKTATTICFVTMCITWLLLRLFVLPFIVWRSIIHESWLVCANGYIPPMYYNMFKPIFVVLLGVLILLHIYWFSLFIRMGYVLIRKGEAHDLSEHKNGEQQNGTTKNKGNKKIQ